MSEPQGHTSTETLTRVVNPIWNIEDKDSTVLDTSITDRYYIKVQNNYGTVEPTTQRLRFLCQNKVDYIQMSETIFHVQFNVVYAGPLATREVTVADDIRSLFSRVQVKLSNTTVEDRLNIQEIAACERLFWTDQQRSSGIATGMMAYDDRTRDVGSLMEELIIGETQESGAGNYTRQGTLAVNQWTAGVLGDPVKITNFNTIHSGNGIKFFMTQDSKQCDAFFRLSDVCDFFKNYKSVCRGVQLEVLFEKGSNYRAIQWGVNTAVDAADEIRFVNPQSGPAGSRNPYANGMVMYVPVVRPSPVQLNLLEDKLAKGVLADVMYERADVYYSPNLTGLRNTWRVVNTPFKITKAIIYFQQYDIASPGQQTLKTLHSFHSNGEMEQVSLTLNGNNIPSVHQIQSFFERSIGANSDVQLAGASVTGTRAETSQMYIEYQKMCHSLAAAYPQSNFTGQAGLDAESFKYNYPSWCFNVAENYSNQSSWDNDRQTSELILNWESAGMGPQGTPWAAGTSTLRAVCVLYTLHQVNLQFGSGMEAMVRAL